MKTTWTTPKDLEQSWFLVDASSYRLGRLASEIAVYLMGKHKPGYTPFIDTGDYIVVVNAEKIQFSGSKKDSKIYYRHSGYMGGLKETTLKVMNKDKPEEVIKLAVRRMLPKNKLGRQMLDKLKVYSGETHPHEAQQPKKIEL